MSIITRSLSTRAFLALVAGLVLTSGTASAQFAERGALTTDGAAGLDVSGRSVKAPRIRAIHTTDADDPLLAGGTAHLIAKDPFLAYQLGRNLNFREFRPRDGIFALSSPGGISGFGGPMVDGTTAKITANNQTSCLGCHNLPSGTPGGGTNFSKDSGFGRNAPHYFGAGIMEMLAIQTRAALMQLIDTNGDGWVSVSEAQTAPALDVLPTADGDPLDYGSATLSDDTTGTPDLNRIFRVWYGLDDGEGNISIAGAATGIDGVTATHYNFEMVVWGWGQRAPPSALNPTNRAFLWDPFAAHTGLESHDPSTLKDPDGDGVSLPTLSGAIQFPSTHQAPDAGLATAGAGPGFDGYSTDDPDGDGTLTEISEGDLDLGEWFMLNAPRPAFAGTEKEYKRGLKALGKFGCTECHVADWTILAASEGEPWAGDRRLFDFATEYVKLDKKTSELRGTLVPLYTLAGDTFTPDFGSFAVTGLFTDFRQHEMGEGFTELAFDGNKNTIWRTPPLWGVGSGFPWGHDGQSLTLEDAILRHGGEAQESRDKFFKASKGKRKRITDFLSKLVLYDIESLPADIDGDGEIEDGFMVAGMDTGRERFNAEWLFVEPVEIEGDVVNTDGETIRCDAAANLDDAYGLMLPLRIDSDLDGWPDAWDADDFTTGYKDGLTN